MFNIGIYKMLYKYAVIMVLSFLTFSFTLFSMDDKMVNTIYEFSAKTIDGLNKQLVEYRGKVVLIVNVASKCGFTPQYRGLEALYEKYKSKGFVILAFPCNQFGGQEPASDYGIRDFCTVNYRITFPIFSKIEVNGENATPLYKYLTKNVKGLITDAVKWNFTKFLVDKNGIPVKRYAPQTEPMSIEKDIEELIGR
jgi:glutathione peroxidase